jgi:hypothetical protein
MQFLRVDARPYFATVRITAKRHLGFFWKREAESVGTGFVFNYIDDNKGEYVGDHFLVTNKHVVSGACTGEFFFLEADDDGKPSYGNGIHLRFKEFGKLWHGHPDSSVDVAVMPFSLALGEALAAQGKHAFCLPVDRSLIPGQQQTEQDISPIEEVVFVGYPEGLYDYKNLVPLARTGITATPYQVDYDGAPVFLIDAKVSRGSSGSPVFFRSGRSTLSGGRDFFAGILSAEYEIESPGLLGSVFSLPKVRRFLRIETGLGVVFKASTVLETIEDSLGWCFTDRLKRSPHANLIS